MGADNFIRRSSLIGKGSLSGGSNCSRNLLFVLRVLVLRVFPTTSFLSRSMGMESGIGTESVQDVVDDEYEVALDLRPAKG